MRKLNISILLFFLLTLIASTYAETIITEDTSLKASINDVPVVIAANNITLDCNGFNINGNGTEPGVVIQNRSGVTIKDCRITDATDGFDIDSSKKLLLLRNTVFFADEDGFDLWNVQSSHFIENTVDGAEKGFFLENKSNSNTFINNVVQAIGDDGFELNDSHRNRFESNLAREIGSDAFQLNQSNGNAFQSNAALFASNGFVLDASNLNFLLGNESRDNNLRAYVLANFDKNRFSSNSRLRILSAVLLRSQAAERTYSITIWRRVIRAADLKMTRSAIALWERQILIRTTIVKKMNPIQQDCAIRRWLHFYNDY